MQFRYIFNERYLHKKVSATHFNPTLPPSPPPRILLCAFFPAMKSPASTTVTAGGTKQRQQQSGPTKRSRVATASARAADNRAASPPTPLAIIAPASLGTLPLPLVSEIGAFSAGGFLSGACRTTLEALRELHYKVDMEVHAHSFSEAEDILCHTSTEHMGLQADGALVTGRAVTRITIKGCGDRQDQEVRVFLLCFDRFTIYLKRGSARFTAAREVCFD